MIAGTRRRAGRSAHRGSGLRRGGPVAAALLGVLCGACAGRGGATGTPADPAAAATCKVGSAVSPFMISLPSTVRSDIGRASTGGVAIVAHDCRGLRVLTGCHAPGVYSMVGLTPRKQVVSLASPIEVQINAPGAPGGDLPAAPISFSLLVGGTLVASRVALVRAELEGACDGATHFIHAIDFGVAGPPGEPPISCFSEDVARLEEIDECGSAIRAHLTPFGPAPSWDTSRGAPPIACPPSTVLTDGKCAPVPAARPYRCRGNDAAECNEQCRRGDAGSCAALGWMEHLAAGEHGVVPRTAFDLLLRACEAGEITACGNAALVHSRLAVPPPDTDIYELYARSCHRGDAGSCSVLGRALSQLTDPEGRELSADYLFRGCHAGSTGACTQLGLAFYDGSGVKTDHAAARALFDRACTDGDQEACTNLGVTYERGDGVTADLPTAKRLYEGACRAGDAVGCSNLGLLFRDGLAVGQDFGRAAELFERGCRGDVAYACHARGGMRERALGAVRDLAGAARDYEKGCAGGHPASCNDIGRLRLSGSGVDLDLPAAAELFRKACDAGEPAGCHNLGAMHEEGNGVAKSRERAVELYRKACEAGFALSCRMAPAAPIIAPDR